MKYTISTKIECQNVTHEKASALEIQHRLQAYLKQQSQTW